jgi:septal ring factor EnvC (AmiA/AmiB activator)
MLSRLRIWFSQLGTFAKIVTLFISALISISGGVIAYNNWIIKKYEKKLVEQQQIDQFRELQGNFKIVIDSLGNLSTEVRSIKPRIVEINKKIEDVERANRKLRDYMIERAQSADESLRILRIWETEKKNGETSLLMTPQWQSILLIPWISK